MVLKDISISSGAPAAHTSSDFMNGKEGNTMLVNGKVNPVLAIKPGQVQRWKIVNASNARFYKLSLASHNLQVIGADGGLLDKPYAPKHGVAVTRRARRRAGESFIHQGVLQAEGFGL